MSSEGYIKFNCEWRKGKSLDTSLIKDLNKWRQKLYSLGLIGAYDNGIGFGNISKREGDFFIITGSETGKIKKLDAIHYTKVIGFDLAKNNLVCEGPIKASSEIMTHGAIYRKDASVNAVIHVHNLKFWKKLLNKVPTTSADATYGTPEMAKEIMRLFDETDVQKKKIIVMAGHEEGVISFGNDLDEAGKMLLSYYAKIE